MGSGNLIGKRTSVAMGRERRADLGTRRFSQRDGELLGFVGEQYAVSVEQLSALIGRSVHTGRWLRDRWRKAGWVESHQILAGGRSFLWLTAEGSRVACSPYRRWSPNPGLIGHIEAVTDVRLVLERELRLGPWRCERALAKELWSTPRTRPHLPDGVLGGPQGSIAVEVELTLKSRVRLEPIVAKLAERYTQVWYFAEPRIAPALCEVAAGARWQNVRVHHYPVAAAEVQL